MPGYIEVAGQKAEVVIANPAGIVVNGGGFINASGATLTTGTPQFSGNSLTGYQVNGGTITVSGTGLDTATTGITTLQAQKIILQGGVFAQDLRVTGDNSAGTANAVAIDVAAIGGMYANKITLLATGQGAGVNNAGTMQANSGAFTLSADGLLTNTGTLNSTATTRINADTVNNGTGGAIYGGSVAIAATTLNNAAATSTSTAPVIAARDSAGRVDIGVQTLNNQEGALIYSAGALAIGGSLDATGQATGRATTVTNNSATLEAVGNVTITTATLANTYASLGARAVVDTSRSNSGSESCGGDCTDSWTDTFYKAEAIEGANGGAVIRAGGNINLDASTSALNSSSQIVAAGTVNVTGTANLVNQGIDLTDTVRTKRDHHVAQGYMDNEVDCMFDFFGRKVGCHSEHRIRNSYSTNYIADNQTVKPGLKTERSTAPSTTTTPNSALFATSSNARYLAETNPAFTNKQIWLSSDYMLQALSVDPDITQKRMGDGFFEQRLINEQVARLTGYARLANYASDEQQYQALMNAGITLAQPLQLRVGIALTAEQVARLTSDIVWLVQQEVTLQDGSKQKVLVPQVYAVARAGDLAANGALLGGVISGNVVNLNTSGDISNSHATLQGRELVTLNATNVRNLAGRIEGKAVTLNATQDIQNIGGAVIAQNTLQATAGRDLQVQTTTLDSQQAASTGNLQTHSTDISRVAGLYVTGDAGTLLASAGRDIQLTGALLQSAGSTTVNAGRNLTLDTVTTSASMDATRDADNYNRTSRSAEVGTSLQSTGNTTLSAGQDFKARAANVQAAGDLTVTAGSNVVIESGVATSSQSSASKTSNSGFMSSSTRTERSSQSSTDVIASNFSGKNVTAISQLDLKIKGSNVSATDNLTLSAGRDVVVESAQATRSSSAYSKLTETGLSVDSMATISVGESTSTQDAGQRSTTQVASQVTGKNINITSTRDTLVKGSQLTASQDVTLRAGQDLVIASAQNTSESNQSSRKTESGASADILRGPLIGDTTQASKGNTQSTTQVASAITGRNISAQAARDATVQASKLLAEQNIMLAAQRNTYLVAAANLSNTTSQTNSNITSTILSMEDKTRADTRLSSTAVGSELVAGNKIEIGIGNAALLSAAQLSAPSIAFTRAAGADTTTDAQLILDGAANTLQVSRTEKTDTLGLWQSATGAGKTEQTLTQTSLKGSTTFDPTLKISVTLPAGDLKTQLASLSSQPGMDYLAALAKRDDVNWQGVKLAHDKWDYAHDGLTPAGAMVVAAVVAYFTAGAGSAAVGTASTTTATATTAAATTTTVGTTVLITSAGAYTAAGLAINAGFTALASQAAVAMINNQGDIGKTLDQLGKEESIKNLVFTMLTAGALSKLDTAMDWNSVNAKSTFMDQFQKNLGNNLASDMMHSALAGKPFDEKTFANSLQGALINTGMAQGAFAIGEGLKSEDLNAFTHKLAHAVLGCAGGAAIAGNGSGCTPGAVGAVVGEMAAQYYNPSGDPSKTTDTVNFAKIMAAVAGVVIGGGGDNVAAVNIAASTGANAAENNRQLHPEERTLAAAVSGQEQGLI